MKTPASWDHVGYEFTLPASETTHRRVVDLARAAMMQAGEVDVDFRAVMAAEVARALMQLETLRAILAPDGGDVVEAARGLRALWEAGCRAGFALAEDAAGRDVSTSRFWCSQVAAALEALIKDGPGDSL